MSVQCECGAGDIDGDGNFLSRNPGLDDQRGYVHVMLSYAEKEVETCGGGGGNVRIVGWEEVVE